MIAQLDRDWVRMAPGSTLQRLLSYSAFEGRPATTRGQWVNPLVLAHLRCASATFPIRRVEPVFLVGVGRSGTTFLGKLLGLHRELTFLNEPKALWNVIDPDEDVSGFYSGSRDRADLVLGAERATPAIQDRALRLYSYYGWMCRGRPLDKYQELSYRIPYLRALFPDCKVIGIVREPVATITSIARWNRRNGRQGVTWWGVNDSKWTILWDAFRRWSIAAPESLGLPETGVNDDARRAAVEWLLNTQFLLDQSGQSSPDLIVRYEDLVERPGDVTQQIMDAVAVGRDDRVLVYAQRHARSQPPPGDVELPDSLRNTLEDMYARVGSG